MSDGSVSLTECEDRRTLSSRGAHRSQGRRKTGLSWLWGVIFTSAFIGFVFPPLNWPDELRNVQLLERGDYGLVYWRLPYLIRDVLSGVIPAKPFDIDTTKVNVSIGWQTFDGTLRYLTASGEAASSYYMAKAANIVIIVLFVFVFAWYQRAQSEAEDQSAAAVQTLLLCLLVPSVAYQTMQISTDLLFLLMGLALYFLRTRKAQLVFSIVSLLLFFEDRSFAILGITGLVFALTPSIVRWRNVVNSPGLRTAVLVAVAIGGIALGTAFARDLGAGASTVASYLSGIQGFGDITDQVAYTWTKNFNVRDGPVLLYSGLLYLPSRTELFFYTLPLYLVALPVAWRLFRIAIKDTTERGFKFFYMLVATLFTHFVLTHTTHVFESGRYYFTLVPLIVVSLASFFGANDKFVYSSRVTGIIAAFLIVLNIVLTVVISTVTLV